MLQVNTSIFKGFNKPISNSEHEVLIKASNTEIPSFDVKFDKSIIKKTSSKIFKNFKKPISSSDYEADFN